MAGGGVSAWTEVLSGEGEGGEGGGSSGEEKNRDLRKFIFNIIKLIFKWFEQELFEIILNIIILVMETLGAKYTGDIAKTQEESGAFFKTSNSGYGGSDENPTFAKDVPIYSEIGARDLALKNSTKTLKHKILAEMREKQALDVEIYDRIKADKVAVKKQDVIPKEFPTDATLMIYPEPVMNSGNSLYMTSNNAYGKAKPSELDFPKKYFPKNNNFTSGFLGGNFTDTGLNTHLNPSRIHKNFDA